MAILDRIIIESDYSGRDITGLSDRPSQDGMTATELKHQFDKIVKEVVAVKLNGLITDLATVMSGFSGARQIGLEATPEFFYQTVYDGLIGLNTVKVDKVSGRSLMLDSDKVRYDNIIEATKEATGFTNNGDIVVTYNPTTRKITLTGTFEAFYKGVKVTELVSGWQSPAHADVQANYYLYYCDSGFVFGTSAWDFDCLMIAFVQYNSHQLGIRETHGFMPYTVHKELHQTIGTYKESGGDFSAYVLASNVLADRRPNISDTYVADEDNKSLVSALSTKSYTHRYLTGSAVRAFNTAQSDIIAVSGSQPYYNQNVGGTWQQTLFTNNYYGAIFVVALPVSADVQSQLYRFLFVQPQQISANLEVIQSLTPSSLTLGESANLVSEFVFIGKIIIRYIGGNWSIISVEKLDGTKISQVATPAGNYLSVVNHDATMTGDGTPSNVLVVANDGHTHDTRYYTESEVDTKDATKADKLMATNLVTNGDFSNGTTGWTLHPNASIVAGVLTLVSTGNAQNSYQDIVVSENKKYYIKGKVVGTDGFSFIPAYLNSVGGTISYGTYIRQSVPSAILTTPPLTTKLRLYAGNNTDIGTGTFDLVALLDLTQIFGAGLEPSKEQIDRLLSVYPDSWFNGTSEFTTLKQLWNEKTDRILATNLVTNGDFSNGTTWWSGAFASVSATANTLSVIGDGTGNIPFGIQTTSLASAVSKKVYVRARVRVTNAVCTQILVGTNNGVNDRLLTAIPLPTNGTWYTSSGVLTQTEVGTNNLKVYARHDYVNSATALSKVLEVQYVALIDLTTTFGAGKEPTALEMDNLLSYFTNSWFNGTTELAPLINILRTKADKTQENWITPTLLNSWVADVNNPVAYKKNNFNEVRIRGLVSGGTAGTVCFTLPIGYRPIKDAGFPAHSGGGTVGRVYIGINGNVTIQTFNTSAFLYSCGFIAEQ